jgi:hypothetical protein
MLIRLTGSNDAGPYAILVNVGQIIAVRPHAGGGSNIETTGQALNGKTDTIHVNETVDEIEKKAGRF